MPPPHGGPITLFAEKCKVFHHLFIFKGDASWGHTDKKET